MLDQNGKVLVDGTYNGFDDEVKQKIRDYLHPPTQDSPEKQNQSWRIGKSIWKTVSIYEVQK